ncbi:hypothetical protein [Rhodobacter sp. NSM]|uniref:hypothetical protein n=1 Tax=Rhodobacter sp. NSM TaxID=3457501 RepID=UPI003FD5D205
MTIATKPRPVQDKPNTMAADDEGPMESLAHLLVEMQGLALVLPPVDRTEAEIEAEFDNMPV